MAVYLHPRRPVVEAHQYTGSTEGVESMNGILAWLNSIASRPDMFSGVEDPPETTPMGDPIIGGFTLWADDGPGPREVGHVAPNDWVTSTPEVLSWFQIQRRFEVIGQ